MKTAAIIGVGLMGGSLGLALRRQKPRWRVIGIGRKPAALAQARRRGLIDVASTDLAAVRGADVIVVAVPVAAILPVLKKIRPYLTNKTLVMDIGSAKGDIVAGAARLFGGKNGPAFVGVHPMAGSEKTGFQFARADLYRGAACIVTPAGRSSGAVRRAAAFWRSLGGRVVVLSPAAHDAWMAVVSHLPHLIADAFILAAHQKPGAARWVRQLAAGSFRDLTRVAGADPAQWQSIFQMNAVNVSAAAKNFIKCLERLMNQKFPLSLLRKARARRDAFMS